MSHVLHMYIVMASYVQSTEQSADSAELKRSLLHHHNTEQTT